MQNPVSKLCSAATIIGLTGSPDLYIVCSQNNSKVCARNINFLRPRDIDCEGPQRTEVPILYPLAQPPSHLKRTAMLKQNEQDVAACISRPFPVVMKSTKQDTAELIDGPTQCVQTRPKCDVTLPVPSAPKLR